MRLALALLALPLAAFAQTPAPASFPVDATSPTTEELTQRLVGKVMKGTAPAGPFRLEYRSSGYVFLNAGAFADSGKFRIEGSMVCVEWTKRGSTCAELRVKGPVIYSKRTDSDVVNSMQADD